MADQQSDPTVELMIERAKRKMATEMPQESAVARIKPLGGFDWLLAPEDTVATTNANNTVGYNPERLHGRSQDYVDDALAHELTHVRQNMRAPGSIREFLKLLVRPDTVPSYGQDPAELEAWQTSKDRAFRDHRVSGVIQPPFINGEEINPFDIQLPRKK